MIDFTVDDDHGLNNKLDDGLFPVQPSLLVVVRDGC